ncbi:hypothetical protein Y032_0058g2940 [Ancylostoma ceylanicum]|uniref:Uncharacterized protein n=1 Tax=Ancylostoma ceylanicum TaxID=53326 RepID=A0A016U505_9BILA|nr:hypothetical protein Y032_0058g2940 [Ancylostoma ceylanicum]
MRRCAALLFCDVPGAYPQDMSLTSGDASRLPWQIWAVVAVLFIWVSESEWAELPKNEHVVIDDCYKEKELSHQPDVLNSKLDEERNERALAFVGNNLNEQLQEEREKVQKEWRLVKVLNQELLCLGEELFLTQRMLSIAFGEKPLTSSESRKTLEEGHQLFNKIGGRKNHHGYLRRWHYSLNSSDREVQDSKKMLSAHNFNYEVPLLGWDVQQLESQPCSNGVEFWRVTSDQLRASS